MDDKRRRRRRWLVGGVVVGIVVLLGLCGVAGSPLITQQWVALPMGPLAFASGPMADPPPPAWVKTNLIRGRACRTFLQGNPGQLRIEVAYCE